MKFKATIFLATLLALPVNALASHEFADIEPGNGQEGEPNERPEGDALIDGQNLNRPIARERIIPQRQDNPTIKCCAFIVAGIVAVWIFVALRMAAAHQS